MAMSGFRWVFGATVAVDHGDQQHHRASVAWVEIPQGAGIGEMKLDGAPPSFYNVVQASAQSSNPGTVTATIPSSKMGTNKRLITVGKLGGRRSRGNWRRLPDSVDDGVAHVAGARGAGDFGSRLSSMVT